RRSRQTTGALRHLFQGPPARSAPRPPSQTADDADSLGPAANGQEGLTLRQSSMSCNSSGGYAANSRDSSLATCFMKLTRKLAGLFSKPMSLGPFLGYSQEYSVLNTAPSPSGWLTSTTLTEILARPRSSCRQPCSYMLRPLMSRLIT